ncbi:STAS domain-containing protein [Streptomyces sp. NBC_01465]|uniref:STAS domain-containing protein n=1 Tax=Streptomyces sp. NBC_01465 TaxID=2903878 RepID=UPI002E2F1C3E|nr:STAS domain-containing protein [Streptomyces sp. NBC_01465]
MPAYYADSQLKIWCTTDPPGVRLAGQVDLTNQAALAALLLASDSHPGPAPAPAPDLTVDLSEVTFLNFSALHVLVTYASMMDRGRRLVLCTRKPVVAEMLGACGWDRIELPLTLLELIPDD